MIKFDLYRDGSLVMTGTENEMMEYIHRNHSFSFWWATTYEGYSFYLARK